MRQVSPSVALNQKNPKIFDTKVHAKFICYTLPPRERNFHVNIHRDIMMICHSYSHTNYFVNEKRQTFNCEMFL